MNRVSIEIDLPEDFMPLVDAVKAHFRPGVDIFEHARASLIPDRLNARRVLGYGPDFFAMFNNAWNVGFSPRSTFESYEHEGKVQHAMDRHSQNLPPLQDR